MRNAAVEAAGPRVEKFSVSGGRWFGIVIAALAAALALILVVQDPSGDVGFAVFGAAFVLVTWVVMIRPDVSVHEQGVLLRNMMRDTFVPSPAIERCIVAQSLQVFACGRRFYGLGVSRSARSVMRERAGPRPGLLAARLPGGSEPSHQTRHRFANEEQTGGTYVAYVEERITNLGREAKTTAEDADRKVVVAWAWAPIAALVVAAACVLYLVL